MEYKMDTDVNIVLNNLWQRLTSQVITNEHKKCDMCKNIFPSEKFLESPKRSVHKKVQFKHTIEREPSFKNHKNKKYT